MILLTYGIYLFHLGYIYTSNSDWYNFMFGNDTLYYKVQYPNITSQIGHLVRLFLAFMHAWNMPMFFYLSGQNAYAALFRRSETQFRNERTHRLIVPTLFMSVVAQFPLTLGYFAPHDVPLE